VTAIAIPITTKITIATWVQIHVRGTLTAYFGADEQPLAIFAPCKDCA
jgi:hypothetical protein